jgi:hypothetical protein
MSQIHDWDTFHDTFARTLGFPAFYGRNMDAWIDCLTYADEDDGMRAITAGPGEILTLQLQDCREFRSRCPEIYPNPDRLRRLRELAADRTRHAIHPRPVLRLNPAPGQLMPWQAAGADHRPGWRHMAVSGGAPLGGFRVPVTSKPKCS